MIDTPGGAVRRAVTQGCPQGSRSGPGFWKLVHETLLERELPTGCELVLYADDTMLLVRTPTVKGLKATTTEALGVLWAWAREVKLTFNATKTRALFYGTRPGQEKPTFLMADQRIRCSDQLTYLGVVLDDGLRWEKHIAFVTSKAKKVTHQLRGACGLTWGLGRNAMAAIYAGAVEPAVAYAAPVWAEGCKVRMSNKLLSVQRLAAIGAAAAYRTVSTEALLVLADLPPIDLRISELAPYRSACGPTVGTLVEQLVGRGSRVEETPTLGELLAIHPADVGVAGSVESIEDGGDDTTSRNRIYTDGSKGEDGTGAAFVVYNGEVERYHEQIRLGEWCSVFQSELVAIRGALRYIVDHRYAYDDCTILTGSKSALEALRWMRKPTKLQLEIWALAKLAAGTTRLRWRWVRAHVGTCGNERADELAKEAAGAEDLEPDFKAVPRSYVKGRLR